MAVEIGSLNAQQALRALGANIKTARLKRRIAVKGFAERVGVSESTVLRLEKGDDGVSIHNSNMHLCGSRHPIGSRYPLDCRCAKGATTTLVRNTNARHCPVVLPMQHQTPGDEL